MNNRDILSWFFGLWFVTIPLTIFIIYITVTELLDLVFNTTKINQLLKHSDTLKSDSLERQYEMGKKRQAKVDQSLLIELDRQIKYTIEIKHKNSWTYKKANEESERIVSAKEISDVFKIK
jgi:hypothetical protein